MKTSPKARFREALLAIARLPGDADARQAEETTSSLMRALLDFGSETPDNLSCTDLLAVRRTEAHHAEGEAAPVLALAGDPELAVSSVLNDAEGCPVPEQVLEAHPTLTQEQWDAVLRMATMVFVALEPDPPG